MTHKAGGGGVAVVGSANLDISVRVTRHPSPGETVLASQVSRSGGGKGANQAVGAARAGGAITTFICALGDDPDGRLLYDRLKADGIKCVLDADRCAPTGLALITVDDRGENSIVVVPGANAVLDVSSAEARQGIVNATVVLAQLEIPLTAVIAAARMRQPGALFILNAAPVVPLPDAIWPLIDILIVNEHEAAELAGTEADALEASVRALLMLVPAVVVTLGGAGCLYADRAGSTLRLPAPAVHAIDTTAAGDTFCGAFAAELAAHRSPREALRFASAAAAITVQRVGAQISIPTRSEAEQLEVATYGAR